MDSIRDGTPSDKTSNDDDADMIRPLQKIVEAHRGDVHAGRTRSPSPLIIPDLDSRGSMSSTSTSRSGEHSNDEDTTSEASSSDDNYESGKRKADSSVNAGPRDTRGRGRPRGRVRGRGRGRARGAVHRTRGRRRTAPSSVQSEETTSFDDSPPPVMAPKRKRQESDDEDTAPSAASRQPSADPVGLLSEDAAVAAPAFGADVPMLGTHIRVYNDELVSSRRPAKIVRTTSTRDAAGFRAVRNFSPQTEKSSWLDGRLDKSRDHPRETSVGLSNSDFERQEARVAMDTNRQRTLVTIQEERKLIEKATHPLYLDLCRRIEDEWQQRQLDMDTLDAMEVERIQWEEDRSALRAWTSFQESRCRLKVEMLRSLEVEKRRAFLRHWEGDPHGSSFLSVDKAPEALAFDPYSSSTDRPEAESDAYYTSRSCFARTESTPPWRISPTGISHDLQALGLRKELVSLSTKQERPMTLAIAGPAPPTTPNSQNQRTNVHMTDTDGKVVERDAKHFRTPEKAPTSVLPPAAIHAPPFGYYHPTARIDYYPYPAGAFTLVPPYIQEMTGQPLFESPQRARKGEGGGVEGSYSPARLPQDAVSQAAEPRIMDSRAVPGSGQRGVLSGSGSTGRTNPHTSGTAHLSKPSVLQSRAAIDKSAERQTEQANGNTRGEAREAWKQKSIKETQQRMTSEQVLGTMPVARSLPRRPSPPNWIASPTQSFASSAHGSHGGFLPRFTGLAEGHPKKWQSTSPAPAPNSGTTTPSIDGRKQPTASLPLPLHATAAGTSSHVVPTYLSNRVVEHTAKY